MLENGITSANSATPFQAQHRNRIIQLTSKRSNENQKGVSRRYNVGGMSVDHKWRHRPSYGLAAIVLIDLTIKFSEI